MNKNVLIYIILFFLWPTVYNQDNVDSLTLTQAIDIASNNSPASLAAKHQFLIGYWSYRIYRSSYLPEVFYSANNMPSYRKKIISQPNDSGKVTLIQTNSSIINSRVDINQNIYLTGGSISLSSGFEQVVNYSDIGPDIKYGSSPLGLSYRQPLSGYNELKWTKKIEPLKYVEAKKKYLVEKESIIIQTIDIFFNLVVARTNYELARINYLNSDTVYSIAEGRYNMGIITQDELLQTELKKLNSEVNLQQRKVQLELSLKEMSSFLGLKNSTHIIPIIPEAPKLKELSFEEVLNKAINNNDRILSLKILLIEANKKVAATKKDKGLNADLEIFYGLQSTNGTFRYLYDNMTQSNELQVSLSFPILDWNRGKSNYRIAKSSLELVKENSRQAIIDFEREVFIRVMNFNLLDEQMNISQKADNIAELRYELSDHRYKMGNIDIFDYNRAISDKENAKRDYIHSLKNYWMSFYEIRKLTLYDFMEEQKISFNELEVLSAE